MLLVALALVGLHALVLGSYGRIGPTGFYTTLAATAVLVLGMPVYVLAQMYFWYSSSEQPLPPRAGFFLFFLLVLTDYQHPIKRFTSRC